MCQEEPDPRGLARTQWPKLAESYIEFRKSSGRYNDLVEVPAMRELLGDVAGLDVLDAGCGTGVQARYCARQGAKVVGLDISRRLLLEARERAAEQGLALRLLQADVENLAMFPDRCFDAIVCSVVLTFRLGKVFAGFQRVLRPGGCLCLSDLHPIFNCGQPEVHDGRHCLVVSGYFDRKIRSVTNPFGDPPDGQPVRFSWRHHTLGDYVESLSAAGFVIERLLEPQPSRDDGSTKAQRANSYPVFFLIKARKRE
jgi:ubiquinone/menaquinone biosynthesis C-methylase UbiE